MPRYAPEIDVDRRRTLRHLPDAVSKPQYLIAMQIEGLMDMHHDEQV